MKKRLARLLFGWYALRLLRSVVSMEQFLLQWSALTGAEPPDLISQKLYQAFVVSGLVDLKEVQE